MGKIVQTVVDVAIIKGEKQNESTRIRLKNGNVVSVGFYPLSTPTENVNIKLETEKGEELHPAVTYKNFETTNGGSYSERFKPIGFKGGEPIEVILTSKVALTEDFKGQLVFNIEQ